MGLMFVPMNDLTQSNNDLDQDDGGDAQVVDGPGVEDLEDVDVEGGAYVLYLKPVL